MAERILLVHNYYQIGGGEHSVFQNEAALLREHGHEVFEYTRDNSDLQKSKMKLLLVPFSTIWSFKTYREIRKIIKEKRIDIVHCHNTFPLISPSVYYAARSRKKPVYQTIHNFRFLCPNGIFFCDGHICELCKKKGSFWSAWKHKCYRNSRIGTLTVIAMLRIHRMLGTYKKINYIFLTEFGRNKFDRLINIEGDNVFVKPNFVYENSIPEEYCGAKDFIFAGRLEENKGVRILIERWKQIPLDKVLHVYGDGTLNEYVVAASKEHKNIIFHGFVSHEEILRKLKTSCALIFPSLWYETFGMSIAESFSVGCPVISSDLGNHAQLVRDSEGGLLFEITDEAGFIQTINDTIENRESLSKKAYSYYKEKLAADENYKILISIYRKKTNEDKNP